MPPSVPLWETPLVPFSPNSPSSFLLVIIPSLLSKLPPLQALHGVPSSSSQLVLMFSASSEAHSPLTLTGPQLKPTKESTTSAPSLSPQVSPLSFSSSVTEAPPPKVGPPPVCYLPNYLVSTINSPLRHHRPPHPWSPFHPRFRLLAALPREASRQ